MAGSWKWFVELKEFELKGSMGREFFRGIRGFTGLFFC
jgi:hypothetical protein